MGFLLGLYYTRLLKKYIGGSVDILWGFHRLAAIYSNHFHTALPVVFLSYIVSDEILSGRENIRP